METPDTEWKIRIREYLNESREYVGETDDLESVCLDGYFNLEEIAQIIISSQRAHWLRSEIEKESKIPSELQKERRRAKLKITKEHSIYGYDIWRGHYDGASISSGGFQNIHETMQSIREVADRLLDEGWEEVS